MGSKGIIYHYLPSKAIYHLKILVGGLLLSLFFNIIWTGNPFGEGFLFTYVIVVLQLEIFMAIALNVFRFGNINSIKEYKRKILTRLVFFYFLVLIISGAFVFLTFLTGYFLNNESLDTAYQHFTTHQLRPFIVSWLIGIGLASLYFLYGQWAYALKREQKLKEEKLIFQYETLKNQVNPHFLFNSLNTLATLVAKDPALSEQFISKFSSIYRYILENKDKELVPLPDEITFAKNYFYLQQIRGLGKVDLQIDIDEPEAFKILPISLQILLENALKHNAATINSPLIIRIFVDSKGRIVVENNIQRKTQLEPSSKIGLKNLADRLFMVMNEKVMVEENSEKFIVKLPLMPVKDASIDHRR